MTDVEHIEFATPTDRKRELIRTELDLVGVTYTVTKPKDASLFFLSSVLADTSNQADAWLQALKFIDDSFDPIGRKSFYERACDRADPLTAGAIFEGLGALIDQWGAKTKAAQQKTIVVEAHPNMVPDLPDLRIANEEMEFDLTFSPPKDVMLGITSAAIGVGASQEMQAWVTTLFLDATLPQRDRLVLSNRLRNRYDDLDLVDLIEIVKTLTARWYPEPIMGNRKARRAAAAKKTTITTQDKPKATKAKTAAKKK
ncbi:hypothetical protein [Nocardiopsis alba]|uniref:hypothetical protein n=1 Tax=Nocardiopsis alba TaxID=53437 RepID=UPI0033AAB8D9